MAQAKELVKRAERIIRHTVLQDVPPEKRAWALQRLRGVVDSLGVILVENRGFPSGDFPGGEIPEIQQTDPEGWPRDNYVFGPNNVDEMDGTI